MRLGGGDGGVCVWVVNALAFGWRMRSRLGVERERVCVCLGVGGGDSDVCVWVVVSAFGW